MLPTPPDRTEQPLALFLDFDGTLVELAQQPDHVQVSEALRDQLSGLADQLQGALAVISGRRLDNLLQHLAPLDLPAAGNHGLEMQLHPGVAPSVDSVGFPPAARRAIEVFVADHPGLLAEVKGQSMALHFRRAPQLAETVRARITQIRDQHAADFVLQAGKMVWELRPAGANKGTAIEAFMQNEPFKDRLPIFIGDDLTDEFGFRTVNELGGWSVHVGDDNQTTEARMGLANVAAVGDWLAALQSGLAGQPHE